MKKRNSSAAKNPVATKKLESEESQPILDYSEPETKKSNSIWDLITNPFVMFIIGLVVGVFFSPQTFFIQHTGFLGFSSYSHEDFQKTFRDNYYSNSSYADQTGLFINVRNSYALGSSVKTILIVPDFVKYECYVLDAALDESCDNYIIPPQGGFRKLKFDIRIGETSKSQYQFCIMTESLKKSPFRNDKMDCIDVTINQDK